MKASDLKDTIDPAKVERIQEFAQFCFKKLGLKRVPQIKLTNKIETTALGYFVPQTDTIVVVVKGRHGMDIMRTLAHELVHLKQSEFRELDGSTGSPDENEANAMAGVLLRVWGKLHPEYFVEERVFTDKEIAIMEGGGSIDDDRTYYIRKQLEQAWKEKSMKVNEIVEEGSMAGSIASGLGAGMVAGVAGPLVFKKKNQADLEFANQIPEGPDKKAYLEAVKKIKHARTMSISSPAFQGVLAVEERNFNKFKESLATKYNIKIIESATAGATSAANVGIGIAYNNKPAAQPKGGKKTKHGKLAPNALDMKGPIVTGGSIGKQSFIKR